MENELKIGLYNKDKNGKQRISETLSIPYEQRVNMEQAINNIFPDDLGNDMFSESVNRILLSGVIEEIISIEEWEIIIKAIGEVVLHKR